MIVYCIIKKGTDQYFPAYYGRGQTHIEFESFTKRPPRIWHKESAAKGWLTTYCKGPLIRDTASDEDAFGQPYTFAVGTVPDPHMATKRNRDDYEIVPMELHRQIGNQ